LLTAFSFGIQAYWGGLAASVVLSSIFPSFNNMANTLPESAAITTQQLIGFIIYICIFTPLMFIHPSKLQPVLGISLISTTCTVFGLFIWALATNGGVTPLPPRVDISTSERSFRILQALSAVAGSWTGACIRQSDWTRFAKSRGPPAVHQLISGPVTVTVCAVLGAFATSAIAEKYGRTIWNPISVLQFLMDNNYDAATRAGCFFAGLGFFVSQVATNLVQNSVSCGMDLAALLPRYIDVTRGALIMCLVGYLINPWRFVNSPGTFITVLSSFGMFVSPLAGINAVDFWIVRRMRWR
jgi:NCS1 family nucleobase:cation symporter-1